MRSIKLAKYAFAALAATTFTTNSHASSLDLNFHDDATRITYAAYTARDIVTDGGALFIDKKDSTDPMFHLGINKVVKNIRFGVQAIYTSPGQHDALAIGFGLSGRAYLSKKTRFDIGGYIAPEFSSMMDSEGYTEFNLRLSYNITEPLDLYVGYRNIKVKIDEPRNRLELDDDLHIGFKVYF